MAFGSFKGSGCYCHNALGEEALLDQEGREALLKNLREQDKELLFNLLGHMVWAYPAAFEIPAVPSDILISP